MAAKGRRHDEEEEHENHERWLVTYADMVTLLMVLFIVMFAMSAVDERKFNELKSGLAAGFNQSSSLLTGSASILDQEGTAALAPIAPQLTYAGLPPSDKALVTDAVQETARLDKERTYDEARVEADRLGEIEKKLHQALKAEGLDDDVRTVVDERGLVLSLVSEHVVFKADMAELTPRGQRVVDTVGPVLAELTEPLQIDGHTNQVKVRPKYYATDWDLSAARALSVLRRLDEQLGLPGKRLSLAAFGHEKPLLDPSDPRSQVVNKRVDIVVQSPLDAETRALLAQAAKDKTPEGTDSDPGADATGTTGTSTTSTASTTSTTSTAETEGTP